MLLHCFYLLPYNCPGYLLLFGEPDREQSLLSLVAGHYHEPQVESSFHTCRKLLTGASSGRRPPLMPRPTLTPSWQLPRRLRLPWHSFMSTASCMATSLEVISAIPVGDQRL